MKKWLNRLVDVLKNPTVRPVETWAFRALIAFVAVKLGLDLK